MRRLRCFLFLLAASTFVCALAAKAQDDAPSLGDVARQSRQQKQQKDAQAKDAQTKDAPAQTSQAGDPQNKDAQGKDAGGNDKTKDAVANEPAKTPHVITNEDIAEPIGTNRTATTAARTSPAMDEPPAPDAGKVSAEQWKSQIEGLKNNLASLKSNIDNLVASIQYAPANCVSGCVQWNERQQQKQQQVETMKAQLEQMQQRLEEMQEAARQQGYGSSVYDP